MQEWTEFNTETGRSRPVHVPDELAEQILATLRDDPRDDPDDKTIHRSHPDVGEFTD